MGTTLTHSVQSQPTALHVHPLLPSPHLEIDHDHGSKSLQPICGLGSGQQAEDEPQGQRKGTTAAPGT